MNMNVKQLAIQLRDECNKRDRCTGCEYENLCSQSYGYCTPGGDLLWEVELKLYREFFGKTDITEILKEYKGE